jgi:hypothetical protein
MKGYALEIEKLDFKLECIFEDPEAVEYQEK